MNQCSGCGENFRTVSLFDDHRVGKHGVREGEMRRRCLTVGEMEGRGWRRDTNGQWSRGLSMPDVFKKTDPGEHVGPRKGTP